MVVSCVPICIPRLVTDIVVCCGTGRSISVTAHLGVNLNALTGKGLGGTIGIENVTCINLDGDIHRKNLVTLLEVGVHPYLSYVSGYCYGRSKLPSSNGNAYKDLLAGLSVVAGSGNGDFCNVLIKSKIIGCFKACCNIHMIEFPNANVVEVESYLYCINLSDLSCNNINIEERSKENSVCLRIVCNNLDRSIVNRIYSDITNDRGEVTLLVAYSKFDLVTTVTENYIVKAHLGITRPGEHIGIVNTVHINLTGGDIDTCVVGHSSVLLDGSNKAYLVVSNNNGNIESGGILNKGLALIHTSGSIAHISKDRSLAVVNSRRVIYSDIINIEYVSSVYRRLIAVRVVVLTILLADIELKKLGIRLNGECGGS